VQLKCYHYIGLFDAHTQVDNDAVSSFLSMLNVLAAKARKRTIYILAYKPTPIPTAENLAVISDPRISR